MRRYKRFIKTSVRIMLGVLLVGLSAGDLYATSEMDMIKRIKESEDVVVQTPPPVDAIAERPVQKYIKGESRDPFHGLIEESSAKGAVETPMPALVVQGVVWGTSLPQAIINGQVVKIGDTIEKARIIDITKDGVVIFFGGREHTILSPGMSGIKKLNEKIEKNKGTEDKDSNKKIEKNKGGEDEEE